MMLVVVPAARPTGAPRAAAALLTALRRRGVAHLLLTDASGVTAVSRSDTILAVPASPAAVAAARLSGARLYGYVCSPADVDAAAAPAYAGFLYPFAFTRTLGPHPAARGAVVGYPLDLEAMPRSVPGDRDRRVVCFIPPPGDGEETAAELALAERLASRGFAVSRLGGAPRAAGRRRLPVVPCPSDEAFCWRSARAGCLVATDPVDPCPWRALQALALGVPVVCPDAAAYREFAPASLRYPPADLASAEELVRSLGPDPPPLPVWHDHVKVLDRCLGVLGL